MYSDDFLSEHGNLGYFRGSHFNSTKNTLTLHEHHNSVLIKCCFVEHGNVGRGWNVIFYPAYTSNFLKLTYLVLLHIFWGGDYLCVPITHRLPSHKNDNPLNDHPSPPPVCILRHSLRCKFAQCHTMGATLQNCVALPLFPQMHFFQTCSLKMMSSSLSLSEFHQELSRPCPSHQIKPCNLAF